MTSTRIMEAYVVQGCVREDISPEITAYIHAAIDHVESELPRFVQMFATVPMIAPSGPKVSASSPSKTRRKAAAVQRNNPRRQRT